jgi:signal peptidase I
MKIFKEILIILVTIIFLPLLLIKDLVKSQRSIIKKVVLSPAILIFFGIIWFMNFSSLYKYTNLTLYTAGVTDKLVKVQISGTSMLPNLKDGSTVSLNSPVKYGISRGDIVTFKNLETGSSSFIKRVVGMPGETISLRNGYVLINGKILEENYTLNHLPTFGSTYLVECEYYSIPSSSYAVLGDNRTVSEDSRILGFVRKDQIDGVIKTHLTSKFVDSSNQMKLLKKEISPVKFLEELNKIRKDNKVSLLVTHQELNDLAEERAKQIRDNFDDWKKQTSAEKLLEEKSYKFNAIHEFVTYGYLDEKQIAEQILNSESEKDQFTADNYTEVGIGIVEKTYKGCSFPIISVIISWPVTPTYDQAVVDSWKKEMEIDNANLFNLQTWVGNPAIDQTKLRRAITLVAQQSEIATRIHKKMVAREWLTSKDSSDILVYEKDATESNAIMNGLFGNKVKGVTTPYPRLL